ncbi:MULTISPECIES: GFA family protein [unclassified Devosia]|jgi:hypothetical protein|uniref:GFA family protein n=1 Tax=unclassified Devosia TaxID=196773 RepID=UPI0008684BC6|nr:MULTISPECIES: GFA family protein [unclassified Devosia]MBN9363665.1 GFA family protein [Devosia sp.]ODS82246.1 MAG: hypothetical protein ABS47_22940 [Devosia sp. SCN 66-27]OJX26969.1 MAG: hypothetical protein BGO83_24415 [Devosia sp. 66-14]
MREIELPVFPVEGGCQCGAVRYRITAPPLAVYNCHCRDCQRASGATHSMSMPIARERVEHLSGELTAFDKPADSGRTVRMLGCVRCGTKLWNEPLASPAMLVVKPGTLDDPSWAAPIGNIWTASRLPWAVIDASQVNFPGQPPDRQPLYDAWSAATA